MRTVATSTKLRFLQTVWTRSLLRCGKFARNNWSNGPICPGGTPTFKRSASVPSPSNWSAPSQERLDAKGSIGIEGSHIGSFIPLGWGNVPFQEFPDCRVIFDQTADGFLSDARVLVESAHPNSVKHG